MSQPYLQIYLIFIPSMMTLVKYGILQLDETAEAFPSPKNESTTEAFHFQFNGTTEMFPSPLDATTVAFPPQHGTPGTTEPLHTTTEAFSWYAPSENSTFCSCEDFEKRGSAGCRRDKDFYMSVKNAPVTMAGSARFRFKSLIIKERQVELDGLEGVLVLEVQRSGFRRTPETTEPLDTMRGVISWWPDSKHVPSENCMFQFLFCEDFPKLRTVWCCGYETYLSPKHWLYAPPVTKQSVFRIKCLRINDLGGPSLGGALVIKEFKVKRSGLQIIPDFSFVKDTIRIIKIEWSRLSSLEGTHLQNLTSVTHFSFSHNAIQHIDPDVFQGTENVEHLDLSYNLLTSIPESLLDLMTHLNTFAASHNHLLDVHDVFSATLPKVILLDFNYLTNANEVLEGPLPNFKKLIDSRMELERYHSLPFWEVNLLNLSHNRITSEHPEPLFQRFVYNFKGVPFFRVQRLLLDGNQLRNLSAILRKYRVVEFRASRNRLEAVYGEDFSMVRDTVNLSLRDNEIRRIDLDVFQPIRSTLQRLDLSCNWIPHLNGSARYLSQLKTLNASYNAIQSFSEDEFTGLFSLSELYLQHNQIRVLAQLPHLFRLGKLDISHNHIQLIRPQQMPSSLRAGTVLSLGDNPFKCDCRLQPFTDWARGRDKERDFAATSPELCLRTDLGNRTWESEECPDLCTCSCRDDFMFVDCSSKSLFAVPQFLRKVEGNKTVDSDVVMRQNRDPLRHFEDRVRGISLENNNLESLEGARLPPNLTLLYLAHNNLRRLPETLLDYSLGLEQMSLAGNPWRCDCSAVTFKKWLMSNNGIFRDPDDIRCGPDEKESVAGRTVWQLTDLDLCPSTPIQLIVSVTFGILTFIIVCLSAKLFFVRYELNIRVFLYSHGLTFTREEDIDQDKVFDVFVSFSHADDEFVIRDIIPVVERKDPDIRLCLHYRHFLAGEFILDNITRAVHSSKRTLLILTRNFLESEWCLQEFRTAHRQSMVDKVHRIIAVKVGDLPKEIDPTLQVYLDCTTYLVWEEVNFWNKLLFVLPTRNAGNNKTVVEDCPDLLMAH